MEQRTDVREMGPHEYAVTITEGTDTTHHRVTVSGDLIDDLGLLDVDERDLVRESVGFLLDRVPADAVEHDFDLNDVLAEYRDDYSDEIVARMVP